MYVAHALLRQGESSQQESVNRGQAAPMAGKQSEPTSQGYLASLARGCGFTAAAEDITRQSLAPVVQQISDAADRVIESNNQNVRSIVSAMEPVTGVIQRTVDAFTTDFSTTSASVAQHIGILQVLLDDVTPIKTKMLLIAPHIERVIKFIFGRDNVAALTTKAQELVFAVIDMVRSWFENTNFAGEASVLQSLLTLVGITLSRRDEIQEVREFNARCTAAKNTGNIITALLAVVDVMVDTLKRFVGAADSIQERYAAFVATMETTAASPEQRHLILHDRPAAIAFAAVYHSGRMLLAESSKNRSLNQQQVAVINVYLKEFSSIEKTSMALINAMKERPNPVPVVLCGDPGVGKSTLTTEIAKAFVMCTSTGADGKPTPFVRAEHMYVCNSQSKYHDGYHNQPVFVFDDIFQVKDPQATAETLTTLMKFEGTLAAPLETADCSLKSTVFFNSGLLICTSNEETLPTRVTDLVASPLALKRRLYIRVHVALKDKSMLDPKTNSVARAYQGDMNNYVFNVQVGARESGEVPKKEVTFEELMNIILEEYRERQVVRAFRGLESIGELSHHRLPEASTNFAGATTTSPVHRRFVRRYQPADDFDQVIRPGLLFVKQHHSEKCDWLSFCHKDHEAERRGEYSFLCTTRHWCSDNSCKMRSFPIFNRSATIEGAMPKGPVDVYTLDKDFMRYTDTVARIGAFDVEDSHYPEAYFLSSYDFLENYVLDKADVVYQFLVDCVGMASNVAKMFSEWVTGSLCTTTTFLCNFAMRLYNKAETAVSYVGGSFAKMIEFLGILDNWLPTIQLALTTTATAGAVVAAYQAITQPAHQAPTPPPRTFAPQEHSYAVSGDPATAARVERRFQAPVINTYAVSGDPATRQHVNRFVAPKLSNVGAVVEHSPSATGKWGFGTVVPKVDMSAVADHPAESYSSGSFNECATYGHSLASHAGFRMTVRGANYAADLNGYGVMDQFILVPKHLFEWFWHTDEAGVYEFLPWKGFRADYSQQRLKWLEVYEKFPMPAFMRHPDLVLEIDLPGRTPLVVRDFYIYSSTEEQCRDACLVYVPDLQRKFGDRLDHFISRANAGTVDTGQFVIPLCVTAHMPDTHVVNLSALSGLSYMTKEIPVRSIHGILYNRGGLWRTNGLAIKGMCGSLLVVNQNIRAKIIGIMTIANPHFGSVHFEPVTYELLANCINQHMNTINEPFGEVVSRMVPELDVYVPDPKTPMANVKRHQLHIIGRTDRAFVSRQPDRSRIRPSLLHGSVPCITAPAHIQKTFPAQGVIEFPQDRTLVKQYFEADKVFDRYALSDVVDEIVSRLRDDSFQTSWTGVWDRLTEYQNVRGVNELTSIVMNTSPGLPWCAGATTGSLSKLPGKRAFFTFEGDMAVGYAPELRRLVDELAEVCVHAAPALLFNLGVKDERRKHSKIHEPRTISTGTCESLVLGRELFGPFVGFLSAIHNDSPIKVGISAHSPQWDHLARKLTRFPGGKLFGHDHSSYDKQLPHDINKAIIKVITDWFDLQFEDALQKLYEEDCRAHGVHSVGAYDLDEDWKPDPEMRRRHEENQQMRFHLWYAFSNALYSNSGVVYDTPYGNPSGSCLTVQTNSVAHQILLYAAFLDLTGSMPTDDDIEVAIYGDDAVVAVAPHCQEAFNFLTLRNWFAARNMTITWPTKDGQEHAFYDDISQVDFLKRSFRKVDGVFYAVLEPEVIFETPQWYHDNNDRREATLQTFEGMCWEAALHGKPFHTQFVKTFAPRLNRHRLSTPYTTYEKAWDFYMSIYNNPAASPRNDWFNNISTNPAVLPTQNDRLEVSDPSTGECNEGMLEGSFERVADQYPSENYSQETRDSDGAKDEVQSSTRQLPSTTTHGISTNPTLTLNDLECDLPDLNPKRVYPHCSATTRYQFPPDSPSHSRMGLPDKRSARAHARGRRKERAARKQAVLGRIHF